LEKVVESSIIEALEYAGLTATFISKKIFEKCSSTNENIQIRSLELASRLHKYLSDITIDQSKHTHYVIKWKTDDVETKS